MTLETERLILIPLKGDQLKLLTENIAKFEKELNCEYYGEEMEGEILEIFEGQVEIVKNNNNYIWHTFWLFKMKNESKFIGSACFKGEPSKNGDVEIGYGINKNYENRGYTTEAVKAMCEWALKQHHVTKVIAETEKDNFASHKILEKCNMKQYKETTDCYWWQLVSK